MKIAARKEGARLKGADVTPTVREEALDLRSRGMSVARISKTLGRPTEWVTALIADEASALREDQRPYTARALEAGDQIRGWYRLRQGALRPSHGPPPPGYPSFEERAAAMAESRLAGNTLATIAKLFGITSERVRQVLLREVRILKAQGQHQRAEVLLTGWRKRPRPRSRPPGKVAQSRNPRSQPGE
ncbi:MAG: hypothetical protein ACYC8T_23720 [Myxococcaceae bacterium]